MNTHDFPVKAADGSVTDLRDYAGQVLLIVKQLQPDLEPLFAGQAHAATS